MTSDDKELLPSSTPAETAYDVASMVTSLIPWAGGPISNVLSGQSFGRKMGRIREVLLGFAKELQNYKSEVSESYVKTEDFEEILEQTLRRVSEERNEEKRKVYRAFLTDAVKSPSQSYDEQIRFLRTMEQLQPDHFKVIRALNQEPSANPAPMGSPSQTLKSRLPEMQENHIHDMIHQLNDLRLANLGSLHTTMTGHGAESLSHSITPYGQRFLKFILESNNNQ